MISCSDFTQSDGVLKIANCPEGLDALTLANLISDAKDTPQIFLHICREDNRLVSIEDTLRYFAPTVQILTFPAWDCLPYDRISPNPELVAQRMATLSHLRHMQNTQPVIVLTTVNAITQKVPARDILENNHYRIKPGDTLNIEEFTTFLMGNGYNRVSTVMEHGDFALRGGLLDIYPPDHDNPSRIDLFGDDVESIREFDPLSQRTTGKKQLITILPVGEVLLTPDTTRSFRRNYIEAFGTVRDEDPLYTAVKEGRRHQGMEHWLPLFYKKLDSLFDYLPNALVTVDHLVPEAVIDRQNAVQDYYQARAELYKNSTKAQDTSSVTYKPISPDTLYINASGWEALQQQNNFHQFVPHHVPDDIPHLDMKGKVGRDFSLERNDKNINIYEALKEYINLSHKENKASVLTSYSVGARDRLSGVLNDHNIEKHQNIDRWSDLSALPAGHTALLVLPLERGFQTQNMVVISEQDLLGDRMIRRVKRSRKAENFLTEASSLNIGDYVVHIDHGIGRFDGLITLDVLNAPHACVTLTYQGDDRLYVPVENIDILSRYAAEGSVVQLDKLGGGNWQARKAKLKERLLAMAEDLIKVAAAREMRKADKVTIPDGMYDEFCARFPYNETDDQLRSIEDIINDLGAGKPMDRLVCGDVGFGKTEVALRTAFLAVMSGLQVALIVPTTLLARQHYKTFTDRFKGFPVRIGQLSRLVKTKEQNQVRDELANGQCDIIVGTHALLSKKIKFKNLGLLIIDEEQHFGVTHKEQLKQLKADIHVLTLTATPIPRTLQMAMTGMRELSLIATPPVDRLAVRTFVLPLDPLVIREALLREHYRGGQSFYVCPRVSDLQEIEDFLKDHVPEVKVVKAHGQMPPTEIEDIMTAFYEGQFDVLLSTTIVESGLDVPRANTLIIHRADMFGLAQLYQLRGRVGRSKIRAYAYLTLPPRQLPTKTAEKRLHVLQTLDTLGAGFTLASHDLDIRGAGNLLGDEQSGHVKEVGFELYQQMLEEAVAKARSGAQDDIHSADHWSPQINVGATVMIPENYVVDQNLRMSLYRRIADLESREDIDHFAAELIDRFGDLPSEVDHLLKIILIKNFCRDAGIEKLETGPKGAIVTFRNNSFANPGGLIEFITRKNVVAKLRPDHRLTYVRKWPDVEKRLKGALVLSQNLRNLAIKNN